MYYCLHSYSSDTVLLEVPQPLVDDSAVGVPELDDAPMVFLFKVFLCLFVNEWGLEDGVEGAGDGECGGLGSGDAE
jgi:hypothetical protein